MCLISIFTAQNYLEKVRVYLVKSGPHVHLIKKKDGHRISELADQGPSNPSNNPISLYPLVLSYPSLAGLCVHSGFCFYLLPTVHLLSDLSDHFVSVQLLGAWPRCTAHLSNQTSVKLLL